MIFGVTGYIASGKDAFCEILEKKGFKHVSLSDLLRKELEKQGLETSRDNLTKLGNQLREEKGDGYLAKEAVKLLDDSNWLISSIGRVAEVKELKKLKGFKLVFIDADQKLRFERLKIRNRTGDVIDFDDFKKQEEKELKGGSSKYREFGNLRKEADIIIFNNDSFEKFTEKVNKFIILNKFC